MVNESARLFDAFINHRGPDVKQTRAIQLYNSLQQLGIRAFLDSPEKKFGESFPSTIHTAMRLDMAIFFKGYEDSPWCLAELILMLAEEFENQFRLKKMKEKAEVIGIFGIGGSRKTILASRFELLWSKFWF
ncbi:hypothetical protein SUGI_0040520 [Cryptomeria japonica]|nr:hypothetical protein SUGI_0040520 [Cryptomeria japonica]